MTIFNILMNDPQEVIKANRSQRQLRRYTAALKATENVNLLRSARNKRRRDAKEAKEGK